MGNILKFVFAQHTDVSSAELKTADSQFIMGPDAVLNIDRKGSLVESTPTKLLLFANTHTLFNENETERLLNWFRTEYSRQ